jgi:hypothetical protein
LTDILVHGIPVYGEEADNLIRKIAGLCSHRELDEWWTREIGWSANEETAIRKAQLQFTDLSRRANESGGELKP